jgi:hypothetical protein
MKFNNDLGAKKGITNAAWCVLLSVFTVAASPQGKLISAAVRQHGDAARAKAEQVLEQAQDVTRRDLKNAEVRGLIVNSRTEVSEPYPEKLLKARPQYRNQRSQGTIDKEFGASLPDKIREKVEANYTTNQWISDRTLNGDRFVQKSDVLVDGKPINFVVSNSKPKSEKEEMAQMKYEIFLTLFPITLDHSWCPPMDFRYVGIAEAKGTKADVIETTLPDETKYRFFFDQQTRLLLLVTETRTSEETNKAMETKFFFSDYRKEDGLLVAHKITTEVNGEVTAESQIKRLQINPTFKPDYFAIKGK